MEMMNELPKGWIECQLDEIFSIKKKKGIQNNTPYLEIGDININTKNYSLKDKPSVKGCKKASKDDVVISRVRPTRGAISLIKENELDVSSAFTVVCNEHKLNQRLLFYYLAWNDSFLNMLGENCTGTLYPTVNEEFISTYKILLPPLNEQHRIVAKLDKILSKVVTAKVRLDTIPQTLKRFRQSVLSAAVSGELTKDWSAKNNINQEWKKVVLSEVAISRLGKMLDKAKNHGEKTKYLRNINVRWFSFDLNDLAELRITSIEKETLDIKNGDLLVCEGGEPGRCAVWENGKTNFTFQKAIHRVRLNKNVVSKWLAFNLKKDADSQRLEDYFTGTTIKHLTGQSIKTYSFSLPPLKEQTEIVRRVEQLFKFADQIEARYNKAKQYTDKLTQSILAKAFRGELVPQDPNDEPAEILLQKINAEKIYSTHLSKKMEISSDNHKSKVKSFRRK